MHGSHTALPMQPLVLQQHSELGICQRTDLAKDKLQHTFFSRMISATLQHTAA